MAAGSLLTLLDDIASVLDDVAVLTKAAARKTAGVLGDDLALGAQQVAGVARERELPVVWAVARGSLVNKAILVPAALLLSALAPFLVTPLLMLGGAYLCYEGCEKLWHRLRHGPARAGDDAAASQERLTTRLAEADAGAAGAERDKIRGAIRTDFVLSAEIVAITLGTVADAPLGTRAGVLVGIALLMTVGVYGLVAGIVKLDDLGAHLGQRSGRLARELGAAIVGLAPRLMRLLSVAGTAAMFLVGGGILVHGVPPAHHAIAEAGAQAARVATVGGALALVVPAALEAAFGVLAGALVLAAAGGARRLRA